ncbi:glycoside hydrolase family 3 N-terminal domain-containing protein [Clostridium perfringens]|uniref:glycoside hydrolase family 3 protein n=1 Tax=Clostridium perfringens TaxID=1502 RepID=UPI00290B2B06|nr:glycoside hydrolase family 3 protein [Clostridium perfringens]EJT6542813.1 glycoside hydrolase family 3 C-terminal domain-containing protein [Clostridium perfringens]EJT6567882.1 glycoside hydrolase family 3 C-terminal domain-containing protein [Clostridium perfringens]MBS5996241.1 glycoside hydrolase family 3 C-terminal domain-containing protein [Clostridium perfringens]MDM0998482.1 glycoside hydrolase family 3 N-terminal domain-containing protein [Clostridium perfringens]MDU5660648.1 glyc
MLLKKIAAILTVASIGATTFTSNKEVMAIDSASKAKEIVSNMTLEEKLGQMIMPDFRMWQEDGTKEPSDLTEINSEVAEVIDKYDLGGVILFAENVKEISQTTTLIHDLQEVAINDKDGNLPLLITLDQEGGIVTRLGEGTNLPGNMALGATRSEKYSYDAGYLIGRELNALGANVNFAPVLDTNNNPENPVIGVRSISSNPELVGKLGKNIAKGIQDQGVAATAKHFPGHGDTSTDSHYGLPMVNKSIEELRETELKPFKIAIENGIDMIMTAHIQFPQIEKDTFISKKDGSQIVIPATLSDDIITGILREEMGYDGVAITDAMNMKAISDHFGELESTKMAINAGIDIILMPTILRNNEDVKKLDYIVNGILDSIKSGEIKEEEITDSVERIVKLKIDRGIIDLKNNNVSLEEKIKKAKETVGSIENRNIERRIAEEAITITKNEDNILPLNPKEGEKVLLIAPNESQIHSMKFGINRLIHENSLNNIKLDTYEYNNIGVIDDVLREKIESSDYIIVASLASNANHLKPGTWNRDLPRSVIDYGNKLNKDTVLISLRNPYDLAAYDNAKAQVVSYGFKGMDPTEGDTLFPTKSSGPNIPASMGVIFGVVEPKGKLPVDIPSLNNDGTMNTKVNYYDYYHGITNMNSLGNVNISIDKKVKLGDNFQVKFNLSDINEITVEKYSAKIKFQGEKLEFIKGKLELSGDLQANIIDKNTLEVLINLDASLVKANEMNFILEFKAIDKAELTSIEITSSELIDAKGRSFNQKDVISEFSIEENKEDKPISPDEGKEDEENNEDLGNSDDNNEEELPQTGSNVGKEFIFGLGSLSLLAGIGLKSKRFKRK